MGFIRLPFLRFIYSFECGFFLHAALEDVWEKGINSRINRLIDLLIDYQ